MADRAEMDAALRQLILPILRQMGFKGSLPHLHRPRGDAIDLLTFQFLSAGGALTIEVGRIHPAGINFHGRAIPPNKLNTSYLLHRHRLGAPLQGGDHWYRFADSAAEAVANAIASDLADAAVWALVDTFELPPHPT